MPSSTTRPPLALQAPMDLATMERRLEGGHFYITLDIFVADMNRIFNNSKVAWGGAGWGGAGCEGRGVARWTRRQAVELSAMAAAAEFVNLLPPMPALSLLNAP